MTRISQRMFLAGLALPLFKKSYNWYVDSVNGNDVNTGRSPASAFQTIAQLLTVLAAGHSIGLARGSSWKEMLTLPGNNCGVYAYGSGNPPLLDGCDAIAAGGWTKTAGQTNIYQITLAGMTVAAPTLVGLNVFENNAQHTYYTSLANLDAAATLPGYYVANPGTATPTLYINASGADKNPATNGKTYEYSKRDNAVVVGNIAYTGTKVYGIRGRRTYATNGVIMVGPRSTIVNCIIDQSNKYGVFIRDGCTVTGCTITDAHHPTEAGMYLIQYNQATPTGLGIILSGNTLRLSATSVPRASVIHGINGHYNTSGTFGALSITGNTLINLNLCITPTNLSSLAASGNTYTNCKFMVSAPSANGDGIAVLPATFTNETWTSNVASQRLTLSNSAIVAFTFTDCTFTATGTASSGYIYITAAGAVTIVDCSFDISSFWPAVYCSSNGATLTISGSTFKVAAETQHYVFTAGANGMTWTSDYNVFDYVTHFQMGIFGVSYDGATSFADYKAATGQDAHSTAS